jgi:hypothetical protein
MRRIQLFFLKQIRVFKTWLPDSAFRKEFVLQTDDTYFDDFLVVVDSIKWMDDMEGLARHRVGFQATLWVVHSDLLRFRDIARNENWGTELAQVAVHLQGDGLSRYWQMLKLATCKIIFANGITDVRPTVFFPIVY